MKKRGINWTPGLLISLVVAVLVLVGDGLWIYEGFTGHSQTSELARQSGFECRCAKPGSLNQCSTQPPTIPTGDVRYTGKRFQPASLPDKCDRWQDCAAIITPCFQDCHCIIYEQSALDAIIFRSVVIITFGLYHSNINGYNVRID